MFPRVFVDPWAGQPTSDRQLIFSRSAPVDGWIDNFGG